MTAEGLKINTDKIVESVDTSKILDNLQKTITNSNLNNLQNTILSQENKENMRNKATESMKKIGDIFKIDIPFLWEIGSLFGTKWAIDLLWTKEERSKNKVLNGILNIFGFKNGMEDVHKLYIQNELKNIDKELANDCYKDYKKSENTNLSDDQKTRSICGLDKSFSSMKDEEKTALQDKIPQDFEWLKNTLITQLPNHLSKLNISTVNMVGDPFIGVDANNQKIIKIEEIQKNITGFIDTYLKLTIPQLVDPQNDFINSINVNAETFAFALFGNLTGEKFFVEWVNLGIENIPIIVTTNTENTENKTDGENIAPTEKLETKKLSELTFEEAKLFAKKVFWEWPATELLYKLSKDNTALIQRVIALGKHEWELEFGRKNVDPNRQSAQINIWTFQISAKQKEITSKRNENISAGEALLKEYNIPYESNYFKKLKNYKEETWDSTVKKAQTDLLVWLWYIENERGWEATFNKLADNTLDWSQVQKLMSTTIQGGISAIGKDVVAQISTKNTDDYPQIA